MTYKRKRIRMPDNVMHTTSVVMSSLLLLLLTVIGAWDIYCHASGRKQDTVSAVITSWSHTFPSLVLWTGYVLGHLFWQSPIPPKG